MMLWARNIYGREAGDALERRGTKVNRRKTEYMCVNERRDNGTVRMQGDEVAKVEDFMIFIRSDTNGQDREWVHLRDSTGGTVWRENTRGKTEVVWTCTEERWCMYWNIGRRMLRMELPEEETGEGQKGGLWMWWKRTWQWLKWRRRMQKIGPNWDEKSAVATKPKEEESLQ